MIDWNAHEKINGGNLITGYLITAGRGKKTNMQLQQRRAVIQR